MAERIAGVGFSNNQESFEAGRQAAMDALEESGNGVPGIVLAFCTAKHDFQACFAGTRSVIQEAPILGGPAIGAVTGDRLGYEGHEVAVAVLPNDLTYHVASSAGLDRSELATGLDLGRRLSTGRGPREKAILLFYDSVRVPPPPSPVLNVSTYLIDGFLQGIGERSPLLVGAGLLGSYRFEPGKMFCGNEVAEQHAVAVLLSGDVNVHTTIMHGCKPMSDYHTITGIEGAVVTGIDDKPAMEIIDDLLGSQDWQKRMPLLTLTLGVNHGELYAAYDEQMYVNRLIVGIVPSKKAVVLFEADFEKGTQFQFMQRSPELMARSAEKGCQEVLARIERERQRPILALYIDCAGRSAGFSETEIEEASIVQSIIGAKMPLLGFYSGVEIAPLLGRSRGLDWTGVLLVLTRDS
jgi:hypothetical protein